MSVTQIEEPNFSKHIVYKKRYCCSRNLSNSNLCKYFRQTFFIFLIINESTEILALPKTKSISSTIPWTSTATEVVHQIFNVRDTAVGIRSRNIEYFTESDGSRSKRNQHCESTAFQCDDGTCIPLIWKCDTKADCSDGSDEKDCDTKRNCNSHQFECWKTKRCIPQEWVCDSDYDCGPYDTSDEDASLCHTKEKCPPNYSECFSTNGIVCIETVKFCDGKFDCSNDEYTEYCDNTTLKAECVALNCSYGCKPTPVGPSCYCQSGQQPNGTFCEDIDECAVTDSCDQICKNVPNSFECSCVAGYALFNKTACRAINDPVNETASIIFITENDIKRVSLSGELLNKSQQTLVNIQTFDIWHRNRSCCLLNGPNNEKLKDMICYNIDDFSISWTFPKPELVTKLSSVDIMRIDWITGNWYFVNTDAGLIVLCTPQLTTCSIVIEIYGQKLNSLELDPLNGFIFFTASESFGSLQRANLDGSNHTIVESYKIFYPTSLKLDLAKQQIYWLDKYMDYIERVNYDGRNRWSMKSFVGTSMRRMHSIALFESQVFVTRRSINQREIWRLNRRDPNSAKMIFSSERQPLDIRVYHRQRQPDAINPCAVNECEHLCVPIREANGTLQARCLCSAGYYLKSRTQCVLVKQTSFLIYAKQNPAMIRGISMSNASGLAQESMVPVLNVKWPLSLDYNVQQQLLYFGQNDISANEFSIESQKLDGTNRTSILHNIGHCHGIAYDWVGENIFWASSSQINVFSLKNINLTKTLTHIFNLGSLTIEPIEGYLYWSAWAFHDNKGQIVESWMDGTHKTVIVDANETDIQWPSSLTIDTVGRKLYWCDSRTKTIERVDLQTKRREIIIHRGINDNFYPFSMAYHNDIIFYTDTSMGNITKVNFKDIANPNKYELLAQENRRITDIKIFDNLTQTESTKCQEKPCPGLLLSTPNGCRCICGNNFTLNASGTKCLPQMKSPVTSNDCGPDRFRCASNGDCIDKAALCDGTKDCSDGSDEAFLNDGPCSGKFNCVNSKGENSFNCDEEKTVTCSSDSFQCKQTKQCIPQTWVCDNNANCEDGSDEIDCPECAEFKCSNGLCIGSEKLCDGVNNCGDGSDEVHCSFKCRANEYFCQPKGCIYHDKLCNGEIDCFDASDEEGCEHSTKTDQSNQKSDKTHIDTIKTPSKSRQCSPTEFKCHNWSECVPMEVRCDGYQDCFDRSDEINCTTIKPRLRNVTELVTDLDCSYPDRICPANGKCIRVDQLCNGIVECPIDGFDESSRCEEKLCDTTSDCSHFCHNSPEGFVCSCPSHMYLKPNGRICSAEHACNEWGTCSQVCEQVGKQYKCKCRAGYTLQYDEFTCRSNNPDSPYVIFSNREEIRGVDLRTLAVKNFFASLRNTIAIDFLLNNNTMQIFWTDVIDDKIYRGTLTGDVIRDIDVVVHSGLLTAEGLAVDWIGNNLYWVDSNLDQIEVAQINGSFRRTLIAGEMDSPRALALDPREGLLFWSDWDKSDPRIERCSMAGEYRLTIIQVDKLVGGWPNGLTLDYAQKRIYYIDAHSDSVHTTNYDGNDHHLVIRDQHTLSHPFSISLFENHVYWTDWRTNSVMRANKWNGSDMTAIDRTSSQPFGIQILHSSRQPRDGFSPCAKDNGGCSHLCLLSVSKTFKCECPHVMQLSADNKTCVQNEQILLFMAETEIRGVDINETQQYIIPTISHATHGPRPNIIDFLFNESRLYWTDKESDEIRTSGLANGNSEVILDTGFVSIGGFAIDHIAHNMYISSIGHDGRSQIHVCNLNGEFATIILHDLYYVTSIALNPAQGEIFFAYQNNNTAEFFIGRTTMAGTNLEVLLNSTNNIASLFLDYDTNRLYFIYGLVGAIQYMDLDNRTFYDVRTVDENYDHFKMLKHIESITVYKDDLYIAESHNEPSIMKCNKDNCTDEVTVRTTKDPVASLKIYHRDAQKGENACSHDKPNNCDHLCLATSSKDYVCKCSIGYNVDPNNSSKCIGEKDFILYSIGHALKGMRLDMSPNYTEIYDANGNSINGKSNNVLAPISRVSLATNIDYHQQLDLLFYADSDKGEITSIKRDGTGRHVIVNQTDQFDANGGDWLSSIAVDWIANNIYWCDKKRNIIEVARLDGSLRYVIVSYVNKPKQIAVDPAAGYLFFIGIGNNKSEHMIGRTYLDGSNQMTLVVQSSQITSFALDRYTKFIYWCEMISDTIWRADYSGNNKAAVLSENVKNPIALTVFRSNLYWVENMYQNGTIKMAPLNNLTRIHKLLISYGNPLTDMKIFSDEQQIGENPCKHSNGGCAELCFFNGTEAVCACSHGEVSKTDGTSCVPYSEFLIYSRVVSIESINLTNNLHMNSPITKIQHPKLLRNTIGLSYYYENQRIFYSDVHSSSINWVHFNGTDHQIIVSKQVSVEGLAYDAISHNLFWTSNSDASIRALNINEITNDIENNFNLVKQVIRLNPHDKPRGIAVEPCMSMIYWTNWNSEAASIQRAYISGYNLQSIITTDIQMPNAITIDHENHKLYWADARLDKIERTDYDGTHRVVLAHSTPKHPFAMAVYKNYLYWTDWVLRAVLRVNKYSGVDVAFLRKDIGRLMGIIVVQNTTHDCLSSPCTILNGGCEDVCSVVAGKIKCECTSGKLASDGKRCIQSVQMCDAGQFRCKSKECIPFHLTCDSVTHCRDGSDEFIEYCNVRTCPPNYFMCNSRRCIPTNQTCDGIEQCGDGSDETICDCNLDEHFKCKSGHCIEKTYRCDIDIDCPDGTDEMNCPNKENDCSGMLKCANVSTCYMESWRCDGEFDCWDKSDEIGCQELNASCTDDKFQCGNGHCIDLSWLCDGEFDCLGHEDELNCRNNGTILNCKSNSFRCANGELCIPLSWQCDENPDCSDGSDEGEHCKKRKCDQTMFQCPNSGRCIPASWRCDGDIDCHSGGEDEKDCLQMNCPDTTFECFNHQCIDYKNFCDGSIDCTDGSDELPDCEKSPLSRMKCGDDQFQCDNGSCLPKDVMCNLKLDCDNGEDENATLCQNSTLICAAPAFYRCSNDACVSESKLCDGENDCGDYSDEQTCGINECTRTIETILCAQNCEDRKVGYECSCNAGFKVSHKDRHLCEDIDECLDRPCSQICTNTYGSYHCSCADGYALKDKHICKAVTSEQAKLIFSNRYYLRETDLHGHSTLIAHNLSNAVALDYDWATKCYYWSDVTSTISKIKRMCPSDNKTVEIHQNNLKNPDGLAVDWVGKNLYWCDKGLDTIEVSKLDGKYRKVLIRKDLQEPRAVAVDPFEKYIYWTDWGSRPHIGKAGLDGSHPHIIAENGFGWPNALTINFETKELYWGDAREDFIGVCDFNGHNQKIILNREKNPMLNLHHVFAIAVWEDRIYWTDWETKSIESCHKDHGDNCSTLLTTIHRPMDIRVFHSYRQRPVQDNPCENAGCDTLCLLSPDPPYYKCDCPNKFYLAADNRTCISNCTSAEFECATTKKCVPFFWRCDTQDDCGDGSDEPATCREFKCEPGQFQCTNGNCINPIQICDGKQQCDSDEIDCDKFVCFDKQFKCSASTNRSSFCLDNIKQCDGIRDCPNGEDEVDCKLRECPRDKFKCNDGKCIPQVWVCDGDSDCSANEDEDSNCNARNCSENEFKCNSGRCIPKSWQCDGEYDCPTREDETSTCKSEDRKCSDPDHFRCNNGKCIPKRWRCDYDFDCSDKSDEFNCTMRNCSESEFRCSNGRCIPGILKCNGESNCVDFSDEENCNVTCAADEFKCSNHICISDAWVCDGEHDCADGSDENMNCTCSANQYQCNENGKCIENRWRCDGWNDCSYDNDSSDESTELCSGIACAPHTFRCHNKRCVRESVVCDGTDDCGDNSDEGEHCRARQKCTTKQFQCERDQNCISKQFRCDAQPHCTDASDEINCKTPVCSFGNCSQICLEKKSGNYNCRCAPGYTKGIEKNDTCNSNDEPLLLIASDSDIRFLLPLKQMDSEVHGLIPISKNKIDVFDIRILPDTIFVYWISSPIRIIQKLTTTTLSSNFKQKIKRVAELEAITITTTIENPKSLAIDWIGERLYILDSDEKQIISTDLNGGEKVKICSTGGQPLDIVVEPSSRLIFWSTLENGISSASMDGTNKQIIVDRGIECVTGLAIDYPTNRLYWADHRKGTIETVLFSGKSRHVITQFRNRTMLPKRLQVFADSLYITLYDQTIYRINKFGNSKGEVFVESFKRASDIFILHPLRQNLNIYNPCQQHPCHNQHICLLSSTDPTGRTCKCPDNLIETVDVETATPVCQPSKGTQGLCPLECNQGLCKIINDQPKCKCPIDFEGEFCEHYRCSGYCKNHGVCYVDGQHATYSESSKPPLKCDCSTSWTGDRCEIAATTCHEPCYNGKCTVSRNGMENCVCALGFTGRYCGDCEELHCENEGICRKDNAGNARCDCPNNFKGSRCENSVCEGFCSGHGQCTLHSGNPQCECETGFWGRQCESEECTGYCENGGTCTINVANATICECLPNYSGHRCELLNDDNINLMHCDNFFCENGGTCHMIRNEAYCNCTPQWNGPNCLTFMGFDNPCVDFCENNGICQLDPVSNPKCVCNGDWTGNRCNTPPACVNLCGDCAIGSSINECLCTDGSTTPCNTLRYDYPAKSSDTFNFPGIIFTFLILLILLTILFGGSSYILRKRRICQPFSHARLNECVEMTNPMYLGELDDTPSFVHDGTKSRFTNPVYESMYAGSSEPTLLNAASCNGVNHISGTNSTGGNITSAVEEKTGLLQQDEPHVHDLL